MIAFKGRNRYTVKQRKSRTGRTAAESAADSIRIARPEEKALITGRERMYKTYLQKIRLVSPKADREFGAAVKQTFHASLYPFDFFPYINLEEITFGPITFFCGGNGSGKTTLLNIIAEKLHLERRSPFNKSSLFQDYVNLCYVQAKKIPEGSRILTSDDVFDFLIDTRTINSGIDSRREELVKEYTDRKFAHYQLASMDEFEEFRKIREAKTKTQSRFVRERLMRNIRMNSNGESAISFFSEHIDENALYLLDEPENSLSIDRQMELLKLILDSARHLGCQFVIATHSPVLLSAPDALIYDLDEDPVRTKRWTELKNVRKYYEFFRSHKDEFEKGNDPEEEP